MASNYNTPTASGRNTPLHFKDVVSFLYNNPFKQLSSLLAWAWDSISLHVELEPVTDKHLTEEHHFNFEQIDAVKNFKHEEESEAHQVRPTPRVCRGAHPDHHVPRYRSFVSQQVTRARVVSSLRL